MSRLKASYTYLLRYPHGTGTVFASLASVLAFLSADYLRPGATDSHLVIAIIYAALMLGALGCAFHFSASLREYRVLSSNPLSPDRSRWIWVILGVLALLALSETNGEILGIGFLQQISHSIQVVLLIAGIGLVVWGLGGTEGLYFTVNWWAMGLLMLITLVGLFLRIWKLESAVHHFIDEANFASVTLYFERTETYGLLRPEIRGFPLIYAWLQHHAIEYWGHNLVGLRMVSVILGTLTIPALYFLAATLFDRKTGLLAAAFLAVFPPHVHFSRLALNNIADPLFGTLALAFLIRGFKHQRRLDFALAGAMLGLTQYFYEGGRLLFPPLLMTVFLGVVILFRPKEWHKALGITLLAGGLVAAPIYLTLYGRDALLVPRLQIEMRGSEAFYEVAPDFAEKPYLQSLRNSILAYTTNSEVYVYYYGGNQGYIANSLLTLVFLGIGVGIWRWRSAAWLGILWVGATIVGTSLMRENLPASRYVVSFPAVALLMALGLRGLADLIWPPKLPRFLLKIGLVAGMALIIVNQARYYFGEHLEAFNYQFSTTWPFDGHDALFRAANFPPRTQVYILTEKAIDQSLASAILQYLNDELAVEVLPPEMLTVDKLAEMPAQVDKAFFIEPTDAASVELIYRHFIVENPRISPFNVPLPKQLILFYAPATLPLE